MNTEKDARTWQRKILDFLFYDSPYDIRGDALWEEYMENEVKSNTARITDLEEKLKRLSPEAATDNV